VDGCTQNVVSVMADETDSGTSVADLVDQLRVRLAATPDRQMKVLEQVAGILGADWPRTARRRFDATGALASVRLLRAADVPRVETGPPEVLAVDLTVDVSGVQAVESAQDLGQLASALMS
jgi:hypothetical protein